MAEALALAVNILAVMQLAKDVGFATYKHLKAYKNTPKEIASLREELGALVFVLQPLSGSGENDDTDRETSALCTPGGQIWLCQDVLQKVMGKLGMDGERMNGIKEIPWPFKEDEIKEHLVKLEGAKSLLELSMIADQSTVQATNHNTAAIFGVVQKMEALQLNGEQQATIRWLHLDGKLTYEDNHKEAREWYQEGTGAWFMERDLFRSWKEGLKKHIWLHGIPGTGKTVLMSTIIATAAEKMRNCPNAYFYFSIRDTLKQQTCNMLSCILGQLSCQIRFPASVARLRERYQTKPGRPDSRELIETIVEVCSEFPRVNVFLDALDECVCDEERPKLLKSVRMLSEIPQIRLIITSRKQVDIEAELRCYSFDRVSIQTEAVIHDINRLYVERVMQDDRNLKRQCNNEMTKTKILERLVEGAQGMFPWVECQINSLRECKTPRQVLSILDSLPKTLYDTYDRILQDCPERDRNYLRLGLAWILYAKHPMAMNMLAEAMTIGPGSQSFADHDGPV